MKLSIQFTQLRRLSRLLSLLLFTRLALLPQAQAALPPPDGGYPGGNTAEGQNALLSLTSGLYNTGIGIFSLLSLTDGSFCTGVGAGTLLANTADENTATGAGALLSNTIGDQNTANGAFALFFNTTGFANTATGLQALFSNTTGNHNTANGSLALFSNTEGDSNAAIGDNALLSNTTGSFNTASGVSALLSNTTGDDNTANGVSALFNNTEGNDNTAIGNQALSGNTIGTSNAATGTLALARNTTGNLNTATGESALFNNTTGLNNTAIGGRALFGSITGSGNIAVGTDAGSQVSTANNVIAIGHPGANADDSCFIGNIFGAQVGNDAMFVFIDSFGKLGTMPSSRRFKREIKPMDNASEAILGLKPVTFHYKSDKENTPRFGLIAEQVAEVNPDLVVRDKNGEIYTVRYDAVNAMLLNEFLKEHKKVQELEATVTHQQKSFARQQAQIETLGSRLQKVSAQIEISRPAQQVASLPAVALREGGNNP